MKTSKFLNLDLMKKNKSNFLDNYATHPELARKTLKAGGVAWSDLKKYPSDYYAANSGSVPGMIYYVDTVKFAKKNHFLILQALSDFENDCGPLDKPTGDKTQYFNWLAWLAWENTMYEVISFLES